MEEKDLVTMWMKFGLIYSLVTCKSLTLLFTGYKMKNHP